MSAKPDTFCDMMREDSIVNNLRETSCKLWSRSKGIRKVFADQPLWKRCLIL